MLSPAPRPAPNRNGSWPPFTLGFLAGYGLLGLGLLLLPPTPRSTGLNLLNTAVFIHAGVLACLRGRGDGSERWGWRVIGVGILSQAVNQAWATLHLLRLGVPPPFPGWGDLFSLLSLALIEGGLLAWPLASTSRYERLRKGIDGLGAALAIFLLSWTLALDPLFHRGGASALERGMQVTFFLLNALILGTCAYLGARSPSRFRGPLGWISLGFVVSELQVTLQVPLTLSGAYHLGHPLDLLVLGSILLIFLAPLAPQALEPGGPPAAEITDRSLLALWLPMLPALSALGLVTYGLMVRPDLLDGLVVGLAAALAGLGLLRGVLALRDLQRLSQVLESRVEARTRDLVDMQQAMLRTERMNAMAVLGAGMAHDLNNALATVRTCAELALARLQDGHPPETRDLDHILVAADQSAALTRRLMAYGHAQEVTPTQLCLREELAHLETILRMLLGRHINLRLELGAVQVPVRGTRHQIEQILVNLVANARDAMPQGGDIFIRLSLAMAAGQPIARVEVEDTGEGMTPEVQAQIFNPFFTTKAPGRGTGLGLASVRQLMHDLGGTLAVASQPGVGTTFVLRFPLLT